jgi:fucose permease
VPRQLEIGIVYLTGLAQGLGLVTFPAAGPILTSAAFHGLSNREYGTLFLPMIFCAILASTLGGGLAQQWGLKRIFGLGLVFNLTSMALLALSHAFVGAHGIAYGLLLTAMAFLGAGFGAALTALNAYAVGFFPGKTDAALTALHAILGIGTALAPLLLGVFMRAGKWWGSPIAIGGLLLGLGLVSASPPLAGPSPPPARAHHTPIAQLRGIPRRIYGYAAIVLLYGICETIFGNWTTIYLHDVKGLSPQGAGYALSTFWAMVTTGRVLVAALSARYSPHRIYLAMPAVIAGAFVVIPMVEGQAANMLTLGVAGLACSAFLPLSISFATQETPDMAEIVSGGMMAAFMAGFGLGAYGVGPILEITGLSLAAIYQGTSTVAVGVAILSFLLTKPR